MRAVPAANFINSLNYPPPGGAGVAGAIEWFEQLRDWAAQSIGGAAEAALTLTGDAFTPTSAVNVLDTEAAASTDDLARINIDDIPDGTPIVIRAASGARVITVKHAAGGTGQIFLLDALDHALINTDHVLFLIVRGTALYELFRSAAAMPTASTTRRGMATIGANADALAGTDTAKPMSARNVASIWRRGANIALATALAKPSNDNRGGVHTIVAGSGATIQTMWTGDADGMPLETRYAVQTTLKHLFGSPNAGAMSLLGSADIVAEAGSSIRWRYDAGTSLWMMAGGARANGLPWVLPTVQGVETGVVLDFAGAAAPSGYLLCYGQAVSRVTYAALFAIIGTTYGPGDGSTTFNLPDCRGRVIAGKDNMGGSTAGRITAAIASFIGTVLGAAGGDQRFHAHSHDTSGQVVILGGGSFALSGSGAYRPFATPVTTTGTGASQNVQPTIIMNKIIKT